MLMIRYSVVGTTLVLINNHQYHCGNLEHSVNESAFVVYSVFLFENISVFFYNY